MKIQVTVFLLVSICFLSTGGYAGRDENMEPAEWFFLPKGDAKSGRETFIHLKCTACHAVSGDPDLPKPHAPKPGPTFGPSQADYTSGWLANSIVSPSHTIVPDSQEDIDEDELSRMGDFSEEMTVRELIDIVAYLKSLK